MHLASSSPDSASASVENVVSGSAGLSTLEKMLLPVPELPPFFGRTVFDERIIHRVAEDDFETAEVFVEGGADPGVPVVQVDGGRHAVPDRLEIRIESVLCEAAGNHLVVHIWYLSHNGCMLNAEDPGTVNASADGRGYAFVGGTLVASVRGYPCLAK